MSMLGKPITTRCTTTPTECSFPYGICDNKCQLCPVSTELRKLQNSMNAETLASYAVGRISTIGGLGDDRKHRRSVHGCIEVSSKFQLGGRCW
jgi:hypothetical protein